MMEITAEIRYDWVELDIGTGGRSILGNAAEAINKGLADATGGILGF